MPTNTTMITPSHSNNHPPLLAVAWPLDLPHPSHYPSRPSLSAPHTSLPARPNQPPSHTPPRPSGSTSGPPHRLPAGSLSHRTHFGAPAAHTGRPGPPWTPFRGPDWNLPSQAWGPRGARRAFPGCSRTRCRARDQHGPDRGTTRGGWLPDRHPTTEARLCRGS